MLVLFANGAGIWKTKKDYGKEKVKNTYRIERGIQQVKSTARDSPCWSNLMKIKHLYQRGRDMVVKIVFRLVFWEMYGQVMDL